MSGKLRYYNGAEWEQIAPTKQEFDDLKNTTTSHLAESTAHGINNKVNKSYSEALTLPLYNGWTGELYVRKNDLNQVQIYGTIVAGTKTAGTQITTIPSEYKNTYSTTYINTGSSASQILFYISKTSGAFGIEIVVPAGVTSISINQIYQL